MHSDVPLAGPLEDYSVPRDRLPVVPGEVLLGRYAVGRVLGAGGMGVVIEATDVGTGERVAIKFMLPDAMKDRQMAARFVREARNAQRLAGEHVVRVTDVGTLDNGAPYLVMEYLEGTDLRGVAKFSALLPIRDVVTYISQAARGVAEAHALGIVHRDIKPHNLFLTQQDSRPCVKVLDFGISKTMDAEDGSDFGALTSTSAVMGSPHYMSPEQMRSARAVDARTDVWSLGVCLYQLLAGHVPFEAETLMELGAKVLHEPPVPLFAYRADLPPQLVDIVMRCLQKDPARRFGTGGELAVALDGFLTTLPPPGKATALTPVTAPGAVPPPGPTALPAAPIGVNSYSGKVDTAWGSTEPPRTRTPTVMFAAATLFGVLMAVFVWVVLLHGTAPPTATDAANASDVPTTLATSQAASPPRTTATTQPTVIVPPTLNTIMEQPFPLPATAQRPTVVATAMTVTPPPIQPPPATAAPRPTPTPTSAPVHREPKPQGGSNAFDHL